MKCQFILKYHFHKKKTSKTPNTNPSSISSTKYNDSFPGQDKSTKIASKKNKPENTILGLVSRNSFQDMSCYIRTFV